MSTLSDPRNVGIMKNRPASLTVSPYCCYSFTDVQLKVFLDEDRVIRAVNEGQSRHHKKKSQAQLPKRLQWKP